MPRTSAAGLVAIVLSSFLAAQCNPFILKSCIIGGRRKENVAARAINDASTGTSDASSVHLKLYQQSSLKVQTNTPDAPSTCNSESATELSKADKNETIRDPNMLRILEYVMVNETSSPFPAILAAVGSGGMAQLELFSIHVFGRNYSEIDGFAMREVRCVEDSSGVYAFLRHASVVHNCTCTAYCAPAMIKVWE
jgi:hypothetical protein